jgi:enoyl-[acyl-carrier protein] reductase I
MGIFEKLLERGKLDASRKMSDGSLLEFERVYPVDAAFDTLDDAPAVLRESKRYASRADFSLAGAGERLVADFGEKPLDIVIHCLANGPEVHLPLLKTSRGGYLAAVGVSAYSLVSMVQRYSPLMRPGGSFLSLTYLASERVIPGYGGGVRVNTISAGPYASRAASVTGIIDDVVAYYERNAPIQQKLTTVEVANTAAFLVSPLATGITGATVYVDKGYHAMGKGADPDKPAKPED